VCGLRKGDAQMYVAVAHTARRLIAGLQTRRPLKGASRLEPASWCSPAIHDTVRKSPLGPPFYKGGDEKAPFCKGGRAQRGGISDHDHSGERLFQQYHSWPGVFAMR
jgi:hypothetical protein